LWFIVLKSFIKKSWAWVKKNWQLVAGFLIACVLFVLSRGKVNIASYLSKAKESYEREIDVINRSHDMEISAIKNAELDRQRAVDEAKKESQRKLRDLEDKKAEIRNDLLLKDEPEDDITERLSNITGINIHE